MILSLRNPYPSTPSIRRPKPVESADRSAAAASRPVTLIGPMCRAGRRQRRTLIGFVPAPSPESDALPSGIARASAVFRSITEGFVPVSSRKLLVPFAPSVTSITTWSFSKTKGIDTTIPWAGGDAPAPGAHASDARIASRAPAPHRERLQLPLPDPRPMAVPGLLTVPISLSHMGVKDRGPQGLVVVRWTANTPDAPTDAGTSPL